MATRTISGRIVIEGYATPAYRQLWRVVDGAVRDAMAAHPNWLASDNVSVKLRNSIVKRVVGATLGYAGTPAWGRPGLSPAADLPDERPASVGRDLLG